MSVYLIYEQNHGREALEIGRSGYRAPLRCNSTLATGMS